MILYGERNPAPNPRRVRIFIAEKGIDLPETRVNMRRREHESPEHRARNSLGQVPTLVLDDGTAISESVSICRYLESVHPAPALFGATAVEQAIVKKPKPIHASNKGQTISHVADAAEPGASDKASMTRPNRIGSAKRAHASATFANASIHPRRRSEPSKSSARE